MLPARDEVTRLGQWLDASVDTIVLITGAWLLLEAELLPLWAAVLVSVRYATPLVVVTLWYFLAAAPPPRHGYVPGRYPGVILLAVSCWRRFGSQVPWRSSPSVLSRGS